ncbi:hypothetical protein B0A69_10275 [Chryseobacterium shigense]|uniref:hypothetical protein n=1 Tax=Chryseobacterium shigense TaxID=297244 RepID=UPI000CF13832|nr:hypothetical protein [Chryseobacterium shigense]PQA93974.1 hypothetical protein B0A69_10275 [Chryseobacterium shigense]
MMKQNTLISLRKSFGILFFILIGSLLLMDCSKSSTSNESETIKATFLVTCITIAASFSIFYLSKKIRRKE